MMMMMKKMMMMMMMTTTTTTMMMIVQYLILMMTMLTLMVRTWRMCTTIILQVILNHGFSIWSFKQSSWMTVRFDSRFLRALTIELKCGVPFLAVWTQKMDGPYWWWSEISANQLILSWVSEQQTNIGKKYRVSMNATVYWDVRGI